MKKQNTPALQLEPLEPRCLLSGFWQGIDVDGDQVFVELSGSGDLQVTTVPEGLGERIDTIAVFNTNGNSKLTVDALANGGDGYVDVDAIDAAGETLKQIVVFGNIGDLEAYAVKKIYLDGTSRSDGQTAQWHIASDVKQLWIWGHLENAAIEIGGNASRVVIEGDVAQADFLVDGQLRKMAVLGDVAEDSLISVLGRVNRIVVYGFLDYSTVETADKLNLLHVGMDVIDADIYADWAIGRIYVDGGIENTVIETPGPIHVIDSWDWIIDTDIVAGPWGMDKLLAYNLSNVNIDSLGNVRMVYLEAYDPYANWQDLYVAYDDYWYWPTFDADYIDVVYYDGYYDFYYDPYYWDAYYYGDVYYDVYVDYFDPYDYSYGTWVDVYW
ncbi:MAG: hypothetical protein JW810_07910 [Sedimentisphaerales bacterium]|nr:hypothetical protein [Sedimentisphaerales bacterium]